MANEFVARKGLIVSGSTNISGSVTASYFKGDGSQLTNLPSTNISSVVINNNSFVGDGTTNTFNLGASYTPNSLMVSVDGLFYTPTADFTVSGNNIVFTSAPPSASDITIRAMTNVVSGAVGTYSGSFTGTFTGTGSWANNAISASYVDASGLPSGTVSSSAQITYTQLQNIPVGIVSSSAQVKELLPTNTVSSSAQVTAFLPNGTVSSSTQINTGSFTGSFVGSLLGTSSWANNAVTASYVEYSGIGNKPALVSASGQIDHNATANYVADEHVNHMSVFINPGNGLSGGGNIAANVAFELDTGSVHFTDGIKKKLNLDAIVSSSGQVQSLLPGGTVSSSAQYPGWVTASSQIDITATNGYTTFSSSIATKNNEQDAAIASLVGVTGSYATTGSNIFNADQTITGSLYITQNLIVQGSSSISYVSQSTLNVGTNVITVNVQNPSVRFGGLSVIDSGSSPQLSGSLFFDSINDQWIFIHQHAAGAGTTSSVLLMGPQTYNNIGNETNLTTNRLPKSVNAEHLGDSQITDDGSIVSITNALSVGTSITASQADITTLRATSITSSVSGALTGTFPYASLTGIPSDIVSSSAQVTSLLPAGTVSSSTQINTGSLQGTASYATNADLFDGKDSTTFATTGSNTFTATQTIAGNLFLSASFPLVYNNNSANNMLFGLFDGSTIHGAYYQTFGNTYPSLSQRGGAEFVYDVRNNSDANFHVASFNGSTWTEKFRVDDTGIIVTGSIKSTGGVTGSLYGTSSWAENAITSSYALNAGAGAGFPFSGSAVITGSLLVSSSGIQTVGGGFTGSLLGTSSAANSAVSSSYALTASFAMNGGGGGGAGFPFVGDAVITGSLYVSGSNISGSFKGDGSQLTGIDIATAVVSDIYKFVGNGSTQLYVLSQSYFTNNVQVSVDGLVQTEGVDYTYTTGSISFVLAPPSSSNVLVTALLNTQNNLSGSFSGSFIGDGRGINNIPLAINIDTYKYSGDGATTDYALNYPYGPNSLFVSVNGVTFVNPDDFILTGSTISFTEVPASASNILIRAFVTQSVINSASFALTASYVEYANIVNKPTLVSASSQIDVRNTTGIQTIATTGSNTFVGNQIISGSINFQSGSSIFPNLQNLEIKPGVGGELLLLNSDSSHYVSIDAPGITITDLTVLSGVTGSLQGTSSWATNAITASFALNAQSGGSGAGFPFSGSAVITGSLRVVPTGSVGGITGSFSGSGAGLHDLRSSLALDTYNFIGDGTTINYVLSQSYTPNSLFVSVEGINYTYIEDFTLSSNTLTFVVAPPSQSNVSIRALLSVSSGSYINYTGSFIGDGYGLDNLRGAIAIESNKFIGDGVTTQYTLSSSYSPQSMLVTVGGLRYIDANDYSLTGSTLNFVQAPASQSIIVAQAYLIISSGSVGTFSGSFLGNATTATSASYATTASFASNVLKTKAGSIASASFVGTPLSASVTFSTAFNNTNYSVAVTGEDARIFTVESKTASGFVVNTNSNTALTGTTYWTCTAYGEN